MVSHGESLLELCRTSSRSVLLAAPYVKSSVLSRLIDNMTPQVSLTVVTRWRPEEIKQGVSDIEIWDLVSTRPQSDLRLCSNLHAKYYRGDDNCLVGSANLTNAALGWSRAPNLELLVPMPASDMLASQFEYTLTNTTLRVDHQIADQMRLAVDLLPPNLEWVDPAPDAMDEFNHWIPQSRYPENIYLAYSKQEQDLTRSAKSTADYDLSWINPPDGLSESSFRAYSASVIAQHRLFANFDNLVAQPRRFGEIRQWIRGEDIGNDPTLLTQTIIRWASYFFPSRYNVDVPAEYSEVVSIRG